MPDDTAPAPQFADAVLIPESMKLGATSGDRMASVLAVAEPLLGVDRSKGEAGWIKHTLMASLDGSFYAMVSKAADDPIRHPKSSPLRGRPRFRWADHPSLKGVRLGYLLDPQDRHDATLV